MLHPARFERATSAFGGDRNFTFEPAILCEHLHLIEVLFVIYEGLLASNLCNVEASSNPYVLLRERLTLWATQLQKDGSLPRDASHGISDHQHQLHCAHA